MYKRITQDMLIKVWASAAKAKARCVKGEGNLFAAFAKFATDNSLNDDQFDTRTKAIEDGLMQSATDEGIKAAIRSSSSSARSVISAALKQERTVVRDGKPVGKTRLEQEKKAVEAGHPAEAVMDASTDALKSMNIKPTDDARIDKAMSIADGLKLLCEGASDALLADIAHEVLSADIRLTAVIRTQCELPLAA